MPPDFLDAEALAEWNRIIPELYQVGLITLPDRAALVGYCLAWSTVEKAERALAGARLIYRRGTGGAAPNPFLTIRNDALRVMKSFLAEFGMTPASRVRLGDQRPTAPTNPFAALDQA